ncbi:MAG: flagellin FliC [Nitrospinae bacterium CG11_big_fil_rev_8_21_14_0_20_56_8]|nr:MAG: flagellin FliC [Nitrospinae bacterium CG11_big_fil_rev_8_21_14_0_20_56_8]
MAIRVFTNLSSQNAQRLLGINIGRLSDSIQKISHGTRINNSSDDVAGLALSESLRSDIRTLRQGIRNAGDGMALINTADGALGEIARILIRMRELASQAANATIGVSERRTLELEFVAQRNEVDRIASIAEFNGFSLLDGSLSTSIDQSNHLALQIGLDSSSANRIDLNTEANIPAMGSTGLGIDQLSLDSPQNAQTALDQMTSAIDSLSQTRGNVGAVENRLQRTLANLQVSVENLTAADSTIRDADIAEEIAILTRNQILTQTATAMVGQTNLIPQSITQLL